MPPPGANFTKDMGIKTDKTTTTLLNILDSAYLVVNFTLNKGKILVLVVNSPLTGEFYH